MNSRQLQILVLACAATISGQAAFSGDIPVFKTPKAAIDWLLEEKNISGYRGEESGSEMYAVKLPSGTEVSNWRIDTMFRRAFRPFGDAGRKFLIPYLGHKHTYVRVGAYAVLDHVIYSQARIHYNFQMPAGQREKAVAQFRAWWAENKDKEEVEPPDRP